MNPDAKYLLGFVLVVRPASQAHAIDRRLPATGKWLDMIEFEELSRFTAMP